MAKEKGEVRFRISNLEDLGYTFKKPEGSVASERIDYAMGTNFEVDEKGNKITFTLNPRFTTGKRDPKLIAELIFRITFYVEGLENVLEINEDEYILPDQLVVTFFSISYSTMRGVFYEKCRSSGSLAERLIIPIIDPKTILTGGTEKEEMQE